MPAQIGIADMGQCYDRQMNSNGCPLFSKMTKGNRADFFWRYFCNIERKLAPDARLLLTSSGTAGLAKAAAAPYNTVNIT
ncbi:hypothetical protein IB286_05880 [Spongiibacter sp. KMU-158]|uniref:Uncharacterized protein n=1 Tax=Spongiibacter pelagi TaxID=2760804 RepID=A0A927C0L9_9GAMM|nr:hypothetical protein [Spongiibacter pelagi]MBD2858534.1 hypothetical protein [Spongiibacter pelagi]